jgi:flagellar biosynthesis protein FlhA
MIKQTPLGSLFGRPHAAFGRQSRLVRPTPLSILLAEGRSRFRATGEARLQEPGSEMAAASTAVAEEPISTVLKIDPLRIEFGYGLLGLANGEDGRPLSDQFKALRRQLAVEMGFVMPPVRIQDNLTLPANTYVLHIKEIEAGRGDLRPGTLLVMDPRGEAITLPGEPTTEPTFGLPAMWVSELEREAATFRGYTVVEPATVITTHLTEIIKSNMAELLSYGDTRRLLEQLDPDQKQLVAEMVPREISVGNIQRVLQALLSERVSIRDLATILEAVSEACGHSRDVGVITEHVRTRLARQIGEAQSGADGAIPLVTLSPRWEQDFAAAIVGDGDDKQIVMPAGGLQDFLAGMRETFERLAMSGHTPVLLTSPKMRPYVRSVVERLRPATVVMSQNEIHPRARIKTLGQI